jgi:hypothetical protein
MQASQQEKKVFPAVVELFEREKQEIYNILWKGSKWKREAK